MVWWDRRTVARLPSLNQTAKIVAEMEDIRQRRAFTSRFAKHRCGAEAMFSKTQWDHEVDVLCIGAEGGVLAAGIVAAHAGFDVYLGISEPSAAGDLAAALSYGGGDRPTTKHLAGFDYAFGQVDRAQTLWPVRAVDAWRRGLVAARRHRTILRRAAGAMGASMCRGIQRTHLQPGGQASD